MGDEELRAVGVGAGVGHGEHSRAGVLEVLVELVFEGVARPARAGALGAAGLDHEIGDDAVELQAVVEALGGEFLEIGHGPRGLVGVEFGADGAAVGDDGGDFQGRSPFIRVV